MACAAESKLDPAYVTQEFIVLEQKKNGSPSIRAASNGSRELDVHERAGVPRGNNQIRITLTGTVGAALQGIPTQHNRDVEGWMDEWMCFASRQTDHPGDVTKVPPALVQCHDTVLLVTQYG
jgi:hypothetical protein